MLAAPEAEAQRQHDVGATSEGLFEGAANRQRMLLGDRALAGAPRVDRNRGKLDELAQLGTGLRPEDSIAAGDQWTLGRVQQFERAVDLGRVAGRAHVVDREAHPAGTLLLVLIVVVQDVLRNLDQRHALRRRDRLAKGQTHVELDRAPVGHALGVFGEAAQHLGAVGFLEGALMVLGIRMLARDADHGAVGHRGEAQSGHRVGQPASCGDHAYPGLAGHPRIGVGGVGGRLLVTHVDQLDFVGCAVGRGSGTGAHH